MKWFHILFCFMCVNAANVSKVVTTVDIVVQRLKEQSWIEDEKPCLDQTLTILNNVRNYTVWAVWIWNSMHHPVGTFYGARYSVGNYDQCLKAPSKSGDPKITTQYCLADITLTSKTFENADRSVLGPTEPYIGTKTNAGRNLNKISWGTCLPSVCGPASASKILKAMYLANPLTPAEPDIKVDYCEEAGQEITYGYGFFAFIILMAASVFTSFFSTYYLQNYQTKCGVLKDIANSFCVKRNWSSLTKISGGEIASLKIFKVFLAIFFVGVHTALFEVMSPISNGMRFDEGMLETEDPLQNIVKHIDLPIDNFITVSGLLLVKGLMDKNRSPIIALINRYFRLMASFAVVMFYVATVSMHTGDGPYWRRYAGREQQACADNWWLGLLLLNNYVNCENICLIVSWYVPCDYQLAVLGTIIYLIWQKKTTLSKSISAGIVTLAVLMPGIITYWRQLPGIIMFPDIEKIIDLRQNDVYLDIYIRGHNRAGPYFIGMAMGYIITKYNPDNYRNVLSKKWSTLLFVLAVVISFKVSTAPLSWATLEYDRLSSALYAVSSRNLWALAFCMMIGVIEYGAAGRLRDFANWHGFTILSRLTYGIYLTHSMVIHQNFYSRRNLQQFDQAYAEALHSLGVTIVSLVASTLLWMFVEAPVNNIVNLFTNPRSKDQSKKKDTETEKITTKAEECNTSSNVNKLKEL